MLKVSEKVNIAAGCAIVATAIGSFIVYYSSVTAGLSKIDELYTVIENPGNPSESLKIKINDISNKISSINSADYGVPYIRRKTDENYDGIVSIQTNLDKNLPKIVKDVYEQRVSSLENENDRLSDRVQMLEVELATHKERLENVRGEFATHKETMEIVRGELFSIISQLDKGLSEEELKDMISTIVARING